MSTRQRGPVEFQLFKERRQGKPTASPEQLRRAKIAPIGRVHGLWNWHVRSEYVRNVLDVDFCMGSHDGHSSFIPIGEVWVSSLLSPTDLAPLLVHEAVEREWMVKRGWSYEKAHDRASMFEIALRKKIQAGTVKVRSVKEAVALADAMSRDILLSNTNGMRPPEKKAASPREPYLAVYLAPKSMAPGIGAERMARLTTNIVKYISPHGSTRYVYFVRNEPVSVLQVVSRDKTHSTIANAFTLESHRRQGYAAKLLAYARKDFRTVSHARDEMLSDDAKAWRSRVGSPRRRA